MQGIRPDTNTRGQLGYRVQDGIFKYLCDVAKRNPDKNFVIVIDEINRSNICRIFSELLFLLQYRHEEISLPDSRPNDPRFSISEKVYVLDTMNTTDRSLAQIDSARRRRFYFYRMLPVVDGTAPLLKRWLEKQDLDQETRKRVLQLFVALNKHPPGTAPPRDLRLGRELRLRLRGLDAALSEVTPVTLHLNVGQLAPILAKLYSRNKVRSWNVVLDYP